MSSTPKQTDTTTTQKVELPAWVDQASQDNYALATDIGTRPYVPYTGQQVAGMNNDYRNAAYDNLYEGQSYLATGTEKSNNVLGALSAPGGVGVNYNPAMIAAQQISGPASVKDVFAKSITNDDINKYMNPYENDVVKSAQTAGQQSIEASQQANSDAAISAGAFGSSRHGVTEGVTAAQGAQNIASTVGQLRSAGFNTALSAAQGDASRADAASMANQNKDMSFQDLLARIGMANQSADLSAQTANQGALADRAKMQLSADQGNQTAGINFNNQLLNSAEQYSANGQAVSNYSQTLGGILGNDANRYQSTRQANLDAQKASWQEAQDYPTQQLNMRLAALGMSPYGKTTSGTSSSTESGGDNPFMTVLGGLMGAKSLFSFSDPKLKENVRTEGTGTAGMKVKSFNYRDDTGLDLPKGRQIGYMADEVEKKMPDAVRRVPIGDGKTARQVDYAQTGIPGVFGFSKRKVAA